MSAPADLFGASLLALERAFDVTTGRALHALATTGLGRAADAAEPLLAEVDEFVRRGRDLLGFWREHYPRGSFAQRFELGRTFNEPATSFGFFDQAAVAGRPMALMGNFQEMLYDQSKAPRDDQARAAVWLRDQLREFVLRYFMRVSDTRDPEGFVRQGERPQRKGFGFEQHYFKRRADGVIGRFPVEERHAIIDLRELATVYEWIVAKVSIYDFNVSLAPLGDGGPRLTVPLAEESYLVLTSDFITDQLDPAPGVLGRFGLGYSFIQSPDPSLLAFGPGKFAAALETIDFEIGVDGCVRVAMAFVVNRPTAVLHLDPLRLGLKMLEWTSLGLARPLVAAAEEGLNRAAVPSVGFDPVLPTLAALNLLTGGTAGRDCDLSREQMEKGFLVKHYMQHYHTLAGSLATWRRVGDWLDEAGLPAAVRNGRQP